MSQTNLIIGVLAPMFKLLMVFLQRPPLLEKIYESLPLPLAAYIVDLGEMLEVLYALLFSDIILLIYKAIAILFLNTANLAYWAKALLYKHHRAELIIFMMQLFYCYICQFAYFAFLQFLFSLDV
jgi:hypothetical protein